jgi:hypothetical protein
VNLQRKDAYCALAVFGAKLAASWAIVSFAGFRQISDDDYARTVIAQTFAHAPRLDPSGTSWLPFPFWIEGGTMALFGRTLGVARAVGDVTSALATAGFFLALRATGLGRTTALFASAVASLGAWNLWTGATPVPEGFTGALVAIGLVALAPPKPPIRFLIAGALALAAGSLSRYETWPACALFSAVGLMRARTSERRGRDAVIALLPLLGPLAWIGWNAHAHGDALHFLARVSRYRQAHGAAGAPLGDKLLVYPRALVRGFPELVFATPAAILAVWRSPRSFGPAALGLLAMFAFLVVGEISEGAPTHHPERALIAITWVAVALAAFGAEYAWREKRTLAARIAMAGLAMGPLAFVLRVPFALTEFPGQGEADRRAQIERGMALRSEGATSLSIVPCAYEHFALIAAYGAPERAVIESGVPAGDPNGTCPRVSSRR